MKTSVTFFMSIFISCFLAAAFNYKSVAQPVSDQEEWTTGQDTLRASLTKAQSLMQQGNSEEALKIYTRLLETCPDSKEAVQGWIMVNAQHMQGPEEMSESLVQLQELYPANTGILFFKAFIEASTGKNEAALKDIDALIQLQPDTALHYILKGQVLGAQENYSEASEAFEIAISLDPSRPDVWGMKAAALAKSGRFEEAFASINKGMELAPNDPVNIYNRACIYALKGDKANALADLEESISMNPRFKFQAVKDEDFKSLYEDEDFMRLTSQQP